MSGNGETVAARLAELRCAVDRLFIQADQLERMASLAEFKCETMLQGRHVTQAAPDHVSVLIAEHERADLCFASGNVLERARALRIGIDALDEMFAPLRDLGVPT